MKNDNEQFKLARVEASVQCVVRDVRILVRTIRVLVIALGIEVRTRSRSFENSISASTSA